MFRSLPQSDDLLVKLQINGREVSVPEGSSVWSAMAVSGDTTTRLASVTEQKRSAYCAMGVCFECLVEIDGLPNCQACLTEVREGMAVKFQQITESSTCLPTPSANYPDSVVSVEACSAVICGVEDSREIQDSRETQSNSEVEANVE